jgi:hypothetical protein
VERDSNAAAAAAAAAQRLSQAVQQLSGAHRHMQPAQEALLPRLGRHVFGRLPTYALLVAPLPHQVPANPADFSTSFEAAALESSTAMVTVVNEVLAKTGVVHRRTCEVSKCVQLWVVASQRFWATPSILGTLSPGQPRQPWASHVHQASCSVNV